MVRVRLSLGPFPWPYALSDTPPSCYGPLPLVSVTLSFPERLRQRLIEGRSSRSAVSRVGETGVPLCLRMVSLGLVPEETSSTNSVIPSTTLLGWE